MLLNFRGALVHKKHPWSCFHHIRKAPEGKEGFAHLFVRRPHTSPRVDRILRPCYENSIMRKRARKTVVTPEDLRRETFILQNEEQVSYMMKHVFFPDAMPRWPSAATTTI